MTVVISRSLITVCTTATIVGLGILFAYQVHAQETEADLSVEAQATTSMETDAQAEARANTAADRATLTEELTASTAQNRVEAQAQVAQNKAALQARAQERVTNLSANMSNRMEAVINRLQNISNRLESRIKKVNAGGVNTTASAAALASARLSLDGAMAEISDIDADVYTAFSSADVGTGWSTLKIKFSTIKNLIKTAHSELRSSISLLKEAQLEARAQQNAQVSS